MTPWGLLAIGAAVILLQLCYILLLRGRARDRERATPDHQPVTCEGCGEAFRSERRAIEHAKADHNAPDEATARYILSERPPE